MGAKREMFKLTVTCNQCEWSGTYKELDMDHWAKHTEQAIKNEPYKKPMEKIANDQPFQDITILALQMQELINETQQQREELEQLHKNDSTFITAMQAFSQRLTQLETTNQTIARCIATPIPNVEGTFLWKIEGYGRKKQMAVEGSANKLISLPFYTSKNGYKMQASIYLNGEGMMGKGTHLSLFLIICKGDFDALLQWPFKQKVTFKLFNQNGGHHIMESFIPDTNSLSFKRPTTDQNIGGGMSQFAPQNLVERDFIQDDTMYALIQVDCSELQDPAKAR